MEKIDLIHWKRKNIWNLYFEGLKLLINNGIGLPVIPEYATNNAHMFYLICRTNEERTELMQFLKENNIYSVSHYQCLHISPYYISEHDNRELKNALNFENCLLRLPLYVELSVKEVEMIIDKVHLFYS